MNTEYLKEQVIHIKEFQNQYNSVATEDKYLHKEISKMIRSINDKV